MAAGFIDPHQTSGAGGEARRAMGLSVAGLRDHQPEQLLSANYCAVCAVADRNRKSAIVDKCTANALLHQSKQILYWTTSLAPASKVCDTVKLRVLAVFALMTMELL